jgi:hypothetical protein
MDHIGSKHTGVAIYYQRLEWLGAKPNVFMCRMGGQEPREDHSMRWFCTLLHQAAIHTIHTFLRDMKHSDNIKRATTKISINRLTRYCTTVQYV